MINQALMVQGTTSDAGKSMLVTALCRWLQRQHIRVAPFKPQNMALNSVVTIDGGEIGRAQAVQARACGLAAHTDMNPILLKPNSDTGAQVIIQGHAIGNQEANEFHDYKTIALKAVLTSYNRLASKYNRIIVEGAGSPAEINLRANDIANMGFAEAIDCPVILISDIDRGGVFAHLVGTLALLSKSEQARVKGFVINRFRGDITLLQSALDWLEQTTGKPVLGVIPYLNNLHLEAEDALPDQPASNKETTHKQLDIIVPVFPHISNHTDFDPLRLHPSVNFKFIAPDEIIPPADLIILPGSKNVRADLEWFLQQGGEIAIKKHLRYGGKIIGICGGFQMLGRLINDPHGLEGDAGSSQGMALFDMTTTLATNKQLRNVQGILAFNDAPLTGYEIHAGITTFGSYYEPMAHLSSTKKEGAISTDGQILGTYLHGLFESPAASTALLSWAGLNEVPSIDYHALQEAAIDRLADTVSQHLDTAQLNKLLNLKSALA